MGDNEIYDDNFKFEFTGDERTDKLLEVINIQGVMTRRMIRSEVRELNSKIDTLKQVNDADHELMKAHDRKQNGHIKDQAEAIQKVSDTMNEHLINHPVPDQGTCPAFKTDKWLRKNWYKLFFILGGVYIFFEWLYHDTALFERLRMFMEHLKIFKP